MGWVIQQWLSAHWRGWMSQHFSSGTEGLEASWGTSHHSRRLESANNVSISDSHSVDALPRKELRQDSQSITRFPQISWCAGLCQKALPHSQTHPELRLLVDGGSNQVDIAGDPSQLQRHLIKKDLNCFPSQPCRCHYNEEMEPHPHLHSGLKIVSSGNHQTKWFPLSFLTQEFYTRTPLIQNTFKI